jgi:hypothetical protein
MTMVDKPDGLDYNPNCDDFIGDVEMTTVTENEINELASMLASIGMEEEIDAEYEAMLDEMYAEHQAMMYAAQSYDNDAIEYGEMV